MWTETRLNDLLTTPPERMLDDLKRIQGDFTILGASGKIGPSLALMLKRALEKLGDTRTIYAVDRNFDSRTAQRLQDAGIQTLVCDLLDRTQVQQLPTTPNVFFLVGHMPSRGEQARSQIWSVSTIAAQNACEHYRQARFVVMSSGMIYPEVKPTEGGATEEVIPDPIGDYPMSNLAREQIFSYYAERGLIQAVLYRLNYAINLRYGVLQDIASAIMEERPVSLAVPLFNCVWQGYVSEIIIRSLVLLDAEDPLVRLNVTGPETASVAETAMLLGDYLGQSVQLTPTEPPASTMYLNHAGYCHSRFGYPTVSLDTLIRWQAEWILAGGDSLGRPSHFDEHPTRD